MRSISIVLCTFNGARYLDEQLRSLRRQKGVQEIVAVDDQSTDDTMAVLHQHAAEDPRVRVYWNERRLGVVANFERAIRLARSEWIALSDQDDVWLPGKIARLRAAWDGGAVLLHHATKKFRGVPPRQLPPRAGEGRKYHGRDARRLLYRNSIVGHTTLVRADVARRLMPFPAEVPHDWWIGVGAALQGAVQYVDEFLVHYRIHDTNAYHRAGSRLHRIRSEHQLRLALLAALADRAELAGALRPFLRDYRALLQAAEPGRFSWALEKFYWHHAALFFGSGGAQLPWLRRARKSAAATLAAAGHRPAERESGDGVFGELTVGPRVERRTGWGLATVSAVAIAASLVVWVFRVEAATGRVTPPAAVAVEEIHQPAAEPVTKLATPARSEEEWRTLPVPPTLRRPGTARATRFVSYFPRPRNPAPPRWRNPAMLYLARFLPRPGPHGPQGRPPVLAWVAPGHHSWNGMPPPSFAGGPPPPHPEGEGRFF